MKLLYCPNCYVVYADGVRACCTPECRPSHGRYPPMLEPIEPEPQVEGVTRSCVHCDKNMVCSVIATCTTCPHCGVVNEH